MCVSDAVNRSEMQSVIKEKIAQLHEIAQCFDRVWISASIERETAI
jgi:hypothetical protein